jgi:hypothetical protein
MSKRRKRKTEIVFVRTPLGQIVYDLFFSSMSAPAIVRKWKPQLTLVQVREWRKHPLRKKALKERP